MTPADLRAWQARMGISALEAARRLGVAQHTYLDWARGISRNTGKPVRLTKVVALACAALEADLPPVGAHSDANLTKRLTAP